MKKIVFLSLMLLISHLSIAQPPTVSWVNNTGTYYVGTFHTTAVSGSCPSTALTTFYHDIPNNNSNTEEIRNESGNNVSAVTDISGLTVQVYPGGASYVIPFCMSGSPSNFGFVGIPVANPPFPFTIVQWLIDPVTDNVTIQFN